MANRVTSCCTFVVDITVSFDVISLALRQLKGQSGANQKIGAAMPNRHLIVLILVFRLTESLLCFARPSSSFQNQSPTDGLATQVATLIINEYLADPPSGASGDANGDGVRDGTQDEFIELVNTGAVPLSIGMFTISDSAQIRFTFPAGKVIPAAECAVVFGGGAPIGAF